MATNYLGSSITYGFVYGVDHGKEGVTATSIERFVVRHKDVPRAQLPQPWSIIMSNVHMTNYVKKSLPNRATSPTCLHCDVTYLSLTMGALALHIPSWSIREHAERRQARKSIRPVRAGRVICRYQNPLYGIINHHKYMLNFFASKSCRFKHNHNELDQHYHQDRGWPAVSIVERSTAWRREL